MTTRDLKYYNFLSILYVALLILTIVIENRIVILGPINILSGSLVLPLTYSLSDAITEVYGYIKMRRLIWSSLIVLYIFSIIIFFILLLPGPANKAATHDYYIVFHPIILDVFTYSVAACASIFINSYLISKWKIIVKGRFFALRSLCSTALGEMIFIILWALLGFAYKFPWNQLIRLMIISYAIKIIYNLIAIVPTAMLVTHLKTKEQLDTLDIGINFNPFYKDGGEEIKVG